MKRLFPAEFVLPGHPDKLCDTIADRLVQEASTHEKRALVGVEVAVHRDTVTVTGRIACEAAHTIDVGRAVRDTFATAGYGYPPPSLCSGDCPARDQGSCALHPAWMPAPRDLKVSQDLCLGPLLDGETDFRAVSDDQSIVTGYAVDLPGTNFLPAEQWFAAQMARRLESLRAERLDLRLGPDGKILALLEEDGDSRRVTAVTASLQQQIGGDSIALHRAVLEVLGAQLAQAAALVPGFSPDIPATTVVNGAGNFAVGGPEGDNGLSGKKLVCDAYGPRVAIGGGALSGKDFYKADRAGALLARRLAKLVVMTGGARECTATLAFFPGDERARVLSLVDGGGAQLDGRRWEPLLDLSLAGVGDCYTGTTDLTDVARHGHFVAERPWETLTVV
ncbi:MAG: methionine adenosyltransferase domain-containing protein [Dehalococcoidia bacterium]|nr:methionine adenosyltransferase domain-containing protein [Dehalococcoidia bacterium]NUQ56680.1 methionine adenosyltransferase domain-containing protein [Dehalococcoidia bacterium]